MNIKIENVIREKFPDECKRIILFIDERFESQSGQIAIASVFIYAKENGKSIEEVIEACKKEMKSVWENQHPEIRGSTLESGKIGKQNREAINRIYKTLGIPTPQEAQETKMKALVPDGSFKVFTQNSVYIFGEDEGGGIRTISSEPPKDFLFPKCIINFLEIGKGMDIDYYPVGEQYIATTAVKRIETL